MEVHTPDVAGAKVRLPLCNAASGLSDLEIAWVVRSLYREDKLDQPQVAQLLGHDKSWVNAGERSKTYRRLPADPLWSSHFGRKKRRRLGAGPPRRNQTKTSR